MSDSPTTSTADSSPASAALSAAVTAAERDKPLVPPVPFAMNKNQTMDLSRPDQMRTAIVDVGNGYSYAVKILEDPAKGLKAAKVSLQRLVDTLSKAGY